MNDEIPDRGEEADSGESGTKIDPRTTLAEWANGQDEWVRAIVRETLSTGAALSANGVAQVYQLFRQEKALDERVLAAEPPLIVDAATEESDLPLTIQRVSDVHGVNAILPGSLIEPHEGLTILFGENGTGKTGYARIFKALADSRTADTILGDIYREDEPQHAQIEYTLGGAQATKTWQGEQGVPPFTRMAIFDSPSVNFHVDDELEYVYVPRVLSIFNHVTSALKAVQGEMEETAKALASRDRGLLNRFPRESTVYPLIETLGASTDILALKTRVSSDVTADEARAGELRTTIAALESDAISTQLTLQQRAEKVLSQAADFMTALLSFDVDSYHERLGKLGELRSDYKAFRGELFRVAGLPAEPEETWEAFIRSGEVYRAHLEEIGAHDKSQCLYCRQPLNDAAAVLVAKYQDYLADKLGTDIASTESGLAGLTAALTEAEFNDVLALLNEYEGREDKPSYHSTLFSVRDLRDSVVGAFSDEEPLNIALDEQRNELGKKVTDQLAAARLAVTELKGQVANRATSLKDSKNELAELLASVELAKSWSQIEGAVAEAKEADRLRILVRAVPPLSRVVTELSKDASDQLINHSFDKLFIAECRALRAPALTVQFVGRQGKPQRKKVLSKQHKPSKVLSEGEQKVLAIADFLAEARLAGAITAPIIFDDPVSSLDHRRINEVAHRVADLAENNQVIVFTHDIFFATTLLSLFEKSKRCSYFQITDEGGKGRVIQATGPRWDSLKKIRGTINNTIQAAEAVEGEARAALVATGYSWIRSWCEVFTETELLRGVTQRYQPNVRMGGLEDIDTARLPAAIEVVTRIFEEACRYIDGHSQPLAILGVMPTLTSLKGHWEELEKCKREYGS